MNPTRSVVCLLLLVCLYAAFDALMERLIPLPFTAYPTKGIASFYTEQMTSTGAAFKNDALTCALRRKDYGTRYNVCSVQSGKCVAVVHNDWGPRWYLFLRGRIIDLSPAAFRQIGDLDQGLIEVRIEKIPK